MSDVISTTQRSTAQTGAKESSMQVVDTPYGRLRVDSGSILLGELLVSDDGAELEVVGLDPLRLELAPEEEEDWGE